MKSKLFNIPKLGNHPIYVQYDYSEKFYGKLHFHNELQFTLIKKGSGKLLCGTSSIHYQEGDFLIIGSMLPHVFIGDGNSICESISVYFTKDWLMSTYPDSNYLNHLTKISKNGVKIANWKYFTEMENVMNKAGIYRLNAFFTLLEKLSESNTKKVLIDKSAKIQIQKNSDSEKINNVYQFINENIHQKIELSQLANLINLTPPSFCRYFKQKTNKL